MKKLLAIIVFAYLVLFFSSIGMSQVYAGGNSQVEKNLHQKIILSKKFYEIAKTKNTRLIISPSFLTASTGSAEKVSEIFEKRYESNGWGVIFPPNSDVDKFRNLHRENIASWNQEGFTPQLGSGSYMLNFSVTSIVNVTNIMARNCGYTENINLNNELYNYVTIIDPIGRDVSHYCEDFLLLVSLSGYEIK